MKYKINKDLLFESVDALVSQTAAGMYSDDGTALYDNVKVHSNERPRIAEFLAGGADLLVQRLGGIAHFDPSDLTVIVLDVPDFDETLTGALVDAMDRYLINYACALWMQRVAQDKVELYLNVATAAIENAATLAKTRKKPVRPPLPEDETETDDDADNDETDDSEEETDNETGD